MDVLVALGTSMAWGFDSGDGVRAAAARLFRRRRGVITLVLLGKLLEARAKARTRKPSNR